MAHEKLIEEALDVLDALPDDHESARPITYCIEMLMAGTWNEDTTAAFTATSLRAHMRQAGHKAVAPEEV